VWSQKNVGGGEGGGLTKAGLEKENQRGDGDIVRARVRQKKKKKKGGAGLFILETSRARGGKETMREFDRERMGPGEEHTASSIEKDQKEEAPDKKVDSGWKSSPPFSLLKIREGGKGAYTASRKIGLAKRLRGDSEDFWGEEKGVLILPKPE